MFIARLGLSGPLRSCVCDEVSWRTPLEKRIMDVVSSSTTRIYRRERKLEKRLKKRKGKAIANTFG